MASFVILVSVLCAPYRADAMTMDFSDMSVYADKNGLTVEKQKDGTFVNQGKLMPGDTITRAYNVTNRLNQPYSLTLRAENAISTPEKFKELIQVRITWGNEVIYDGNLIGETDSGERNMLEELDLGMIDPTTNKQLKARFHFPGPELTNAYQRAHAEVDWILVAKLPEETTTSQAGTKDEPTTTQPGDTTGSPKPSSNPSGHPSTGDQSQAMQFILIAGISVIVILALATTRKRKNEEFRS